MAAISFLILAFVAVFGTILFTTQTCSFEKVHALMDQPHGNSTVLGYLARKPKYSEPQQQVLVRRATNLLLVDPGLATSSTSESLVVPSQEFTSIPTTAETSISSLVSSLSSSLSSSTLTPVTSSSLTSQTSTEGVTSNPLATTSTLSSIERSSVSSDIAPLTTESSSTSITSSTSSTSRTTSSSSSVSGSETTQVFSSVVSGRTVVVTQTSIVTQSTSEPSSSTSTDSTSSSSGLSDTNKIVVGVVVGVGGAILMAFAALMFILKRRKSKGHQSGWTFWRKNEKGGEDNFFSGELGVRDRDINQGSNF
ncbi:hypothetical protein METBIDRAFT_220433 [Metschnikowia bicuspidata var. bicuspidata NRRL YB-4993]|uniref:Mid2 domain-containing protein n=1 Tax=Metschnikowia bicuspidata var. bicuspidata NRRL YB-4993 TaxID=869754 RepID=A0A1A0H5A9_9ASCO|nr:hypothetical protein METBIDRAFT_220433 [Metschnikowia bicuspidata var. bicuspidata NRRL YB-4993]OBA19221.1 hypothetical protein METBIDRAFT_220433 [Metschnikowia bicuspidata var. bicuspidata NRRL YB-4993]